MARLLEKNFDQLEVKHAEFVQMNGRVAGGRANVRIMKQVNQKDKRKSPDG
jgi:hypothetical protein